MIFPLRVFGSVSVNRMSSGLASEPIAFATHFFSSSFQSDRWLDTVFQTHERGNRLPLDFIRAIHFVGI